MAQMPLASGFPGATLTPHARTQILRRGLTEAMVLAIAGSPEQVVPARRGRVVAQTRADWNGTPSLIRVVIDIEQELALVVTAYRTSKIEKYWSRE